MSETETDSIIREVQGIYNKIKEHSQRAEVDAFLNYYHNSTGFLSISSDGIISNYEEFKSACIDYYSRLKSQEITTITEKYYLVDEDIVIVGWMGKIIAEFRNGDKLQMKNYAITSIFKKIDDHWKVIHDHESAPPVKLIKKD